METNFNYNEFKAGKVATTLIGKAIKFITELRDGTILVAQEKYRGYGFKQHSGDTYRYHKDGTAVNHTPYNQLFFAA